MAAPTRTTLQQLTNDLTSLKRQVNTLNLDREALIRQIATIDQQLQDTSEAITRVKTLYRNAEIDVLAHEASIVPNGLLILPTDVLKIISAYCRRSPAHKYLRPRVLQLTCKRFAQIYFSSIQQCALRKQLPSNSMVGSWYPLSSCRRIMCSHSVFHKPMIAMMVAQWSIRPLELHLMRDDHIENLHRYFKNLECLHRPIDIILDDSIPARPWLIDEFIYYIDKAMLCRSVDSITIAQITLHHFTRHDQIGIKSDNYRAVIKYGYGRITSDFLTTHYLPYCATKYNKPITLNITITIRELE